MLIFVVDAWRIASPGGVANLQCLGGRISPVGPWPAATTLTPGIQHLSACELARDNLEHRVGNLPSRSRTAQIGGM